MHDKLKIIVLLSDIQRVKAVSNISVIDFVEEN
jgi:hypothetical protein